MKDGASILASEEGKSLYTNKTRRIEGKGNGGGLWSGNGGGLWSGNGGDLWSGKGGGLWSGKGGGLWSGNGGGLWSGNGGGLWSGIWSEAPFARLYTIAQDLFIHQHLNSPPGGGAYSPAAIIGSQNYSTTQAFTVLSGTHLLPSRETQVIKTCFSTMFDNTVLPGTHLLPSRETQVIKTCFSTMLTTLSYQVPTYFRVERNKS